MRTVFISSTSRDLDDYRAVATQVVMSLGMHPVVMDSFPAMDQSAVDACRRLVQECDAFIGIYAYRYGYIPVGETMSITELEFEWAKKAGLRIFTFVAGVPYSEWPKLKDEKTRADFEKLESFKRKIGTNYVWKEFTTPDSLGTQIALAFRGLTVESRDTFHSLSAGILMLLTLQWCCYACSVVAYDPIAIQLLTCYCVSFPLGLSSIFTFWRGVVTKNRQTLKIGSAGLASAILAPVIAYLLLVVKASVL